MNTLRCALHVALLLVSTAGALRAQVAETGPVTAIRAGRLVSLVGHTTPQRYAKTVSMLRNAWESKVPVTFSTDADYYVPGKTRGGVAIEFIETWKADNGSAAFCNIPRKPLRVSVLNAPVRSATESPPPAAWSGVPHTVTPSRSAPYRDHVRTALTPSADTLTEHRCHAYSP